MAARRAIAAAQLGRYRRATTTPPARPVLHIATVHYGSPQWVEIQTRQLRENIIVPYETWTSLEKIDPSYGRHFDHVVEQRGLHAAKLNHLAMEICHVAAPEDLMMFLDGDAFPVADPMPLIERSLAQAPLLAVRRAENADEPQPHPSFCVTTVGTWRTLPGDWSAGPTWRGARGQPTSDVGGHLLRELELSGVPWVQVLRSNRRDLDQLYFGIYGDVIYHHGAGFRSGELSPAHRTGGPAPVALPRALRPLARLVNGVRFRRWERGVERRHLSESQRIFELIQRGGDAWLSEFG
jgi:hypothetical protein